MAEDVTLAGAETPRGEPNPGLPRAKLVDRRDITEDLMVIKLEPEEGPFTFKPGQYCTLGLDGIERAYSIVSAPHEPLLEIFVELVPDGALTPRLWRLRVGDYTSIRPRAKGRFVFKPSHANQLLVATVTGVVPYVSFVRHYLHAGLSGHHFYIIEGASYQDELVYDAELGALAAEHPELITFVPTLSRPAEERNAGWTGETGRANEIVEQWVAKWELSPEDTLVYACGHPGMIEDVKARFLPRGFKLEEERFWKQD